MKLEGLGTRLPIITCPQSIESRAISGSRFYTFAVALKASDSGCNARFLALDALSCSFLSKASDSDTKAQHVCLALDSLSHSLLVLVVPSSSNSLSRFIAILLLSLVAMNLRLQNA